MLSTVLITIFLFFYDSIIIPIGYKKNPYCSSKCCFLVPEFWAKSNSFAIAYHDNKFFFIIT